MVFFAGLPGTGKSLLIHQLSHLAHTLGRKVFLLQWDLSRPVFEAAPAGQRYPLIDGVTHVVIRRAVGLWAREKVATWSRAHAGRQNLLLGEAPLVGNRLIELVTPADDAAEAALTAATCSFVLPVPSDGVRRHIESERRRRLQTPLHQRELEDASPDVMAGSWRDLVATGRSLGVVASETADDPPYQAETYQAIYERLLQQRQVRVMSLDTLLPTRDMSVYDQPDGCELVLPRPDEVERWVLQAEAHPLPESEGQVADVPPPRDSGER